jgi:hypothetical protein
MRTRVNALDANEFNTAVQNTIEEETGLVTDTRDDLILRMNGVM